METSPQIDALAKALAAARPKFGRFAKDQTASISSAKGSYKYSYGDLAALFDATTDALSANGLALSQCPDWQAGAFVLVTTLMHESGQFIRSCYPLRTYDRPQEQGSEITYARRYAAAPILGIAADVDDDGAAAQGATPKAAQQATARPTPVDVENYQAWRTDLAAFANDGMDALQEFWRDSPKQYRDHIFSTDKAGWEALKVKAASVKPAEVLS